MDAASTRISVYEHNCPSVQAARNLLTASLCSGKLLVLCGSTGEVHRMRHRFKTAIAFIDRAVRTNAVGKTRRFTPWAVAAQDTSGTVRIVHDFTLQHQEGTPIE